MFKCLSLTVMSEANIKVGILHGLTVVHVRYLSFDWLHNTKHDVKHSEWLMPFLSSTNLRHFSVLQVDTTAHSPDWWPLPTHSLYWKETWLTKQVCCRTGISCFFCYLLWLVWQCVGIALSLVQCQREIHGLQFHICIHWVGLLAKKKRK